MRTRTVPATIAMATGNSDVLDQNILVAVTAANEGPHFPLEGLHPVRPSRPLDARWMVVLRNERIEVDTSASRQASTHERVFMTPTPKVAISQMDRNTSRRVKRRVKNRKIITGTAKLVLQQDGHVPVIRNINSSTHHSIVRL